MEHGGAVVQAAIAAAFAPRRRLSLSEWADAHRKLSRKSASSPGEWRTARTPYLREIMDCLSTESPVREVVFWSGTQLGKSETCNNWLGYIIDHNPGPVMLVQPTLDLAKRYSKQRISSLIESTPAIRNKVRPSRARDSGNTLLEKEFDGGILVIAGANSAAGLRSMPARDLLFDEVDAYPLSIDDEGDPISIAEKRQDTFSERKRLKTSTCTIKGESRIEQSYNASDKRRYFVPCPDCGHAQVLRWPNLQWSSENPADVRYACEDCGTLIEEANKPAMLAAGEWRAEAPDVAVRGYWLNSLYSPLGWLSWAAIVREFLDAKAALAEGDQTLMQVWVNTRLAETWELQGNKIAHADLQKRAEPYALRTVPRGVLLLTASVDVQGDRLEYAIFGWGLGGECWWIDYAKIDGDPAEANTWERLDAILKAPLRNAFGIDLLIEVCAIDHGGHHSLQVEQFTRYRQYSTNRAIAIKGQSQPGKQIIGRPTERESSWKGKKIRAGARVFPVGSDTGKHELFNRLRVEVPGPGYIHFSNELDDDFYKGLTAEQLVTRHVKGRPRHEWTLKRGARNEPLDLWVYGFAAFHNSGWFRRREHEWKKRAELIEPALFAPTDDAQPTDTPTTPPATAPTAPAASNAPRRIGRIGRLR